MWYPPTWYLNTAWYHFSTTLEGAKMASVCEDGVYQLEDGYWAYRFSIIVDGRRISRKKRTDEQGKKLRISAVLSESSVHDNQLLSKINF